MAEEKSLVRIIGESLGEGIFIAAAGGIIGSIAEDEKYLNALASTSVLTFALGFAAAGLYHKLYRKYKD